MTDDPRMSTAELIRNAVLNERLRCMNVATAMLGNPSPGAWPNIANGPSWNAACLRIAEAIERDPTPPTPTDPRDEAMLAAHLCLSGGASPLPDYAARAIRLIADAMQVVKVTPIKDIGEIAMSASLVAKMVREKDEALRLARAVLKDRVEYDLRMGIDRYTYGSLLHGPQEAIAAIDRALAEKP